MVCTPKESLRRLPRLIILQMVLNIESQIGFNSQGFIIDNSLVVLPLCKLSGSSAVGLRGH